MKTMQNLVYVGTYSTLQTEGKVSQGYTFRQNELYNRLMFGLKLYTPEELYAMNSNKKNRIKKAHHKAQQLLNLYKQRVMIDMSNQLLTDFKPTTTANKLFEDKELDPQFFCTLSFKDLGIRKNDLVELFINYQLLPADFKNAA